MRSNAQNLHEQLAVQLIRRGLPADYACRAAAEIDDHHRDLIDELQSAGMSESQARTEALRRLGNSRALVKSTVRAYQRRYWCGRWPLITFLLTPIPMWIAAYLGTAMVLTLAVKFLATSGCIESNELHIALRESPRWLRQATAIWLFVGSPTLVAFCMARLAKRAALGRSWIVLAACLLAFTVGSVRMEPTGLGRRIYRVDPVTKAPVADQPNGIAINVPLIDPGWWYRSGWRRWYGGHPMQACQFVLPLAAACFVLIGSRQRGMRELMAVCEGS
jgi:hypothetical protein